MKPMHFTPRDGKPAPWWALLLGLLLTGAATLFGGWGLGDTAGAAFTSWRAQAWPTANAFIESVEWQEYYARNRKRHRVVARYCYAVENKTYRGGELSPLGPPSKRTMYDFLIEHQRDRTPVRCYYDPSNPERAFLDRRLSVDRFLKGLLVFGGLFLVGGFMLQGIARAAWRHRPGDV